MAAPIPGRVDEAFVSAMHISLLAAAGAALMAAVGVIVLLSGQAGYSSLRQARISAGSSLGVRLSKNE